MISVTSGEGVDADKTLEMKLLPYVLLILGINVVYTASDGSGCNLPYIANQVVSHFINTFLDSGVPTDESQPLEEQAVIWNFQRIDENGDNLLEDDEVNFPRYLARDDIITASDNCVIDFMETCFIDEQNSISLAELMTCTLQQVQPVSDTPAPTTEDVCPEQMKVDFPQCLPDESGCSTDRQCADGWLCCPDVNCNYKMCTKAVTEEKPVSEEDKLKCPLNHAQIDSRGDDDNEVSCLQDADCKEGEERCCWHLNRTVCIGVLPKPAPAASSGNQINTVMPEWLFLVAYKVFSLWV